MCRAGEHDRADRRRRDRETDHAGAAQAGPMDHHHGLHPAGRARQSAIGAFSAAGGAAAGLGPLLGGLLVDTLGWRWIFWINVPVGLLVLAGALLRLREPARETPVGRIDALGAVLAVTMLFALNYALIAGPGQGWGSLSTVLTLVAGLTLPILVVAPLAGRLGQQISAFRLMAAGFALIMVAFLLMARVGPDSDWSVAFPGLVLLGVGGALVFPPLLGVTLDVVPRERAGMASGLSNTFFPLGTATGVAAFGAIFTARIGAELPGQAAAVAGGRFDRVSGPALETARTALTGALSTTCLVAAAAGLAGVAISLLLIRTRDLEPEPVAA